MEVLDVVLVGEAAEQAGVGRAKTGGGRPSIADRPPESINTMGGTIAKWARQEFMMN